MATDDNKNDEPGTGTDDNQTPEQVAAAEAAAEEAAKAEAEAKAEADKAKEEAEGGEGSEDDAEDNPLDTTVWGDHGEVANSALALIQNSGGTPDEAKALLFDAVSAGDISKIDVAALEAKVGKNNATLVIAGVKDVIATNKAAIEAVTAVVNEAAGSADNWTKVSTWANENLDGNDLDELRAMLSAGGRQAKYAAKDLVAMYNDDKGNTSLDAGKETVNGDGKVKETIEPLEPREANRLMNLAIKNGEPESTLKTLLARKRAYKP